MTRAGLRVLNGITGRTPRPCLFRLGIALSLTLLGAVASGLPAAWAQEELFVANFYGNSITVYARRLPQHAPHILVDTPLRQRHTF